MPTHIRNRRSRFQARIRYQGADVTLGYHRTWERARTAEIDYLIGRLEMERQKMTEGCEPCTYFKDERTAVTVVGWDHTPVCSFHADNPFTLRAGTVTSNGLSAGPRGCPWWLPAEDLHKPGETARYWCQGVKGHDGLHTTAQIKWRSS